MMLDASMTWMVVGLVSGLIGVFLARRFLAPRRPARVMPLPPPASRQERRRRERDSGKR